MNAAQLVTKSPFWVVTVIVPLFLPDSGLAQLRAVEQTVFGMDCSPCAYALEKRIKRMDGVQSVSVSLDEGLARIEFKPDHVITLDAVRSAVTESGFSPEDAAVEIRGVLRKEGERWLLLAGGERFILPDLPSLVTTDSVLTVAGRVPKEKAAGAGAWTINVSSDLR